MFWSRCVFWWVFLCFLPLFLKEKLKFRDLHKNQRGSREWRQEEKKPPIVGIEDGDGEDLRWREQRSGRHFLPPPCMGDIPKWTKYCVPYNDCLVVFCVRLRPVFLPKKWKLKSAYIYLYYQNIYVLCHQHLVYITLLTTCYF